MIGLIVILVCYSITFAIMLRWRHIAHVKTAELSALQRRNDQSRDVAQSFLNCCRLLSIHRNGRLNVFTFARGDQIFTVETMGLLSDNPDEWRTRAGLTQ